MNIGSKISELRKKNNMTQEELAEKLNITRQTISKWELNETTPNLEDAHHLAKILKVSLNELVGSENILEEKMSNVERLAGIIIKILKVIGILMIIYFIFLIGAILAFAIFRKNTSNEVTGSITCTLNDKTEIFQVTQKDNELEVSENVREIIEVNAYHNSNDILNAIIEYVEKNGGICD